MKFKTKIDGNEILIETASSPDYSPLRKEELPGRDLKKAILTGELGYYYLIITINDCVFYEDGLLLSNEEEEHKDDLEEYIDQEDIFETLLNYINK